MVTKKLALCGLSTAMVLQGCATAPMGPSMVAAKGPNVTFDQYEQDQAVCKQYASQETAGQAEQANNNAVGSAVLGTVLGAGLGAAIGGGRGAAIGAAGGAAIGTSVGANQSTWSNMSIQQRYDSVYLQCMSAKGNTVPVYQPPPPAYYYRYQPPPPGYYAPPPPPPPGY
jgi:uncharacterized protein YcfJ